MRPRAGFSEHPPQLSGAAPTAPLAGGLSPLRPPHPLPKRTRNAACRACCVEHFHGRWDASCVLSYVEAEG